MLRRALFAALAVMALLGVSADPAAAQQCSVNCGPRSPPPAPPPPPEPPATVFNGVTSGLFDITSRFMWDFGDRRLASTTPNGNTQGGGAASDPVAQRFRAWTETYGVYARTSDHDQLFGDVRRTGGVVAGLGVTIAPGAQIGLAVDQGWTRIDIGALQQSAKINLTQIGVNSSLDIGQFTVSAIAIRGFANVDSNRVGGLPGAVLIGSYRADLWAAMGEVSYFWSMGESRIVPKIAFDWMRTNTGGFAESGALDAVTVSAQSSDRARAYAGLEVGHYWRQDKSIFDVSTYGRFVDIVLDRNDVLTVMVPGTPAPVTLQGTTEGRYGLDAGAAASLRLDQFVRFYVNYDARLRNHFQAHGGTLGVEVKW